MKIIKIAKRKIDYLVTLDDKRKLSLLESTLFEFNLYINKDISNIKEIEEYNEIEKGYELAIKRLKISEYSPNKIKEYLLKKNVSKDVASKVLIKLEKFSVINEENIIENIISYCDAKHYGYKRIIQMLSLKGISKKNIDNISLDLQRENKESELMAEIIKNKQKTKNNFALRKCVYESLIRYGFSEQIAKEKSTKIQISEKVERNMLKLDYSKLLSSYSRKVKGKELKEKIFKSLLSKGYRINDIKCVMEEMFDEMD